ncbi:mitochondrial import inner membrane translocase subunit tim21 [Schaereria dolodes]|nr:mitochondrial import inner membrane translocase subunit tim21 [Schaereria dolodes]
MQAIFSRNASLISKSGRVLVVRRRNNYSTQNNLRGASTALRKQVTVTNDDGRVQWRDLTVKEKAARTTQQTFNLGVILAGLFMTGGVAYFLYAEVFSTDSKTSHFNRAVNQLRTDPRAIEVLGPGKDIRAFGEPSWSKWTRNRPIASSVRKDGNGCEHLLMHFNVEGSEGSGVVNMHMTKKSGLSDYQYKYLALDVKGQSRIYLENADEVKDEKKAGMKMFGVKWR